ncbi:MAG: hypothetical protein K6B75_08555, partial [Lachnospiraceae bacterium]|nr:hypothetical protein [Lachnospiraceae bacterium]
PVEIQGLWYNALKVMEALVPEEKAEYARLAEKVKSSFNKLYYIERKASLADCMGNDPFNRTVDDSIRPNQLFALSMPFSVVDDDVAEKVLHTAREKLLTGYGLRSLAPDEKGYIGDYEGNLLSRDKAYHMGTTWPFLFGTYADAYLRVYKGKDKDGHILGCLKEFYKQMDEGCINGIAEVSDGNAPAEGKGCYTQAWSVGEVLRIVSLFV